MYNEYMFKENIRDTSLRSYCRLEGLNYLQIKAAACKKLFAKKEQGDGSPVSFSEIQCDLKRSGLFI